VGATVLVIVLGGYVGPVLVILLGVIGPAVVAGVLGRLLRASLVMTLPIAASVLLVNVFFFPGGRDVLLQLGPITATGEGVAFALVILLRLLAIAGAITLFYLTTTPGDLTIDLERRGVPPRLAFVANASVGTVPAMLARAGEIIDAQRARGLDTQGGILARVRGIVPIVVPVVLGSIAQVEERTLALEARAFGRPGRRTLLRTPADSARQSIARWLIVLTIPGVLVARAAGAPI
jgi:energy-coupling factor transport system permease protein